MIRPRIIPESTSLDKSLEAISKIILLATWVIVLLSYSGLPSEIPIHFNARGEVDGHANRIFILIIPMISSILFVGLTILNRYPHKFNYPVKVDQQNALKLYTHASRMIRILNVAIGALFLNSAIGCILIARGIMERLPVWLFPVELFLLFLIIAIYLIRIIKSAR